MLLLWCFRTAHIVLKTLVNGELFLNQETSTPVAPIPPWILTIGQFKQSVILNSTCGSAWMESSGKASKPIFDGMCPLFFFFFSKDCCGKSGSQWCSRVSPVGSLVWWNKWWTAWKSGHRCSPLGCSITCWSSWFYPGYKKRHDTLAPP